MSRPTGPGATATRLWAVAVLTFREAIRRKIFLIVLIFAVALVGSAPFLPAMTGESRLRLIEVWSVRAAFVFSLILAVFLAGFSITGDIETRRIYTLVSKPIHKVTIFMGKFLGFTLMIGAFLGATGVLTMAYLRTVAAVSPRTGDPKKDFPPLRVEPRFEAATWRQDPLVVLTSGEKIQGRVAEEAGAVTVTNAMGSRKIPRDEVTEITQPPPRSINITQGYWNAELGAGKIIGGEKGAALIWEFRGLDKSAFEPDVKARLKIDLGRINRPYELEGSIVLHVRNPTTGATLVKPLTVKTNQTTDWSFSRDMIDEKGNVVVSLLAADDGLIIIAKSDHTAKSSTAPRAMMLFGRSELFELSYFKGLVLVLFQSMVILAIVLTATTVLTAPVSILMGILFFFLGWFWPFLQESVRDIDTDLASFRKEAVEHDGHGHSHGPPMFAPPWAMRVSYWVSWVTLKLVPNFDLFNMSDYLLKDLAVMRRDLVDGFGAMLPRVAVLLFIGVIFMWMRDFAG